MKKDDYSRAKELEGILGNFREYEKHMANQESYNVNREYDLRLKCGGRLHNIFLKALRKEISNVSAEFDSLFI